MGRYMEAPAGQLLCGRADRSARDSPTATGARQPIERVPVQRPLFDREVVPIDQPSAD
jgi:hypothetical protein